MNRITIDIEDSEFMILRKIFQNEPNFQPLTQEDQIIVAILKKVLEAGNANDSSYEPPFG